MDDRSTRSPGARYRYTQVFDQVRGVSAELTDVSAGRVHLRPVGGGEAWTADPADVTREDGIPLEEHAAAAVLFARYEGRWLLEVTSGRRGLLVGVDTQAAALFLRSAAGWEWRARPLDVRTPAALTWRVGHVTDDGVSLPAVWQTYTHGIDPPPNRSFEDPCLCPRHRADTGG